MVLELKTPLTDDWQGLTEQWPTLLAYIISFDMIYIVWYNHHNLFQKAEKHRKAYLSAGRSTACLCTPDMPFAWRWRLFGREEACT